MARVYVSEDEEADEQGRLIFSGRFSCAVDGSSSPEGFADDLPFDDAVAWARAQADAVYVRFEGSLYSAGARADPELLPWPPADLRSVLRRRSRGEEWLDRTDADSPEVVMQLSPPDCRVSERSEAVVSRAADRLRAEGFGHVRWSGEGLAAGVEQIAGDWREAGSPAVFGWVGSSSMAFEARGEVDAPTHVAAAARARAAVAEEIRLATGTPPYGPEDEDLSGRWGIEVECRPPGFEGPLSMVV